MAFIFPNIDAKDQQIEKAIINEDGSLGTREKSTLEEFEKHLATVKLPKRAFIKEPVFEDLKDIFGKHVEILINY
jgi:hypothetical protein